MKRRRTVITNGKPQPLEPTGFGNPIPASEKRGRKVSKINLPAFKRWPLKMVTNLARLGVGNKGIAEFYEVSEKTVEYWVRNFPEFKKARDKGSYASDAKVVQSLFKRAIGFEYDEKQVTFDAEGSIESTKVTRKVIPGDVKAAIHWLRVRQSEVWTLPEMSMKHSGSVDHNHKFEEIPTNDLTKDEKDLLFSITRKQLTSGLKDN